MRVLKYKRGQIWWYKNNGSYDGSVQGKTRPVIILSNDLANANSRVLIGVPLTSQIKRNMPTHVVMDIFGVQNTALGENLMSLNIDRLTDYVGCLDDELLNRVEDCCKVALGLVNIPNFRQKIDKVIDSAIGDDEIADEDDMVYKLTDTGKDLIGCAKSVEGLKHKGRKPRYTNDEDRLKFITDYEVHGWQYMVDNYGEKSAAAVYAKVYKFRKRLGISK